MDSLAQLLVLAYYPICFWSCWWLFFWLFNNY